MTWLAFWFALELGLAPQIGVIQYEPVAVEVRDWNTAYVELAARVELFEVVFGQGAVRTYILPNSLGSWWPVTAVYDIGAGVRWKGLELGWRHRCFHPVIPYQPIFEDVVVGFEGAYDELYLRFEHKF